MNLCRPCFTTRTGRPAAFLNCSFGTCESCGEQAICVSHLPKPGCCALCAGPVGEVSQQSEMGPVCHLCTVTEGGVRFG